MKWISVKDRPLYTKDKHNNWVCTEDGDKEFLAAVPYKKNPRPSETFWWIRHCVVEDETGLCVVGDDCNDSAGWDLESISHWMPLPETPH